VFDAVSDKPTAWAICSGVSDESKLIGKMSSDMGSSNLFDPMLDKLIEPGCLTRDWTQSSDSMLDKPIEPGLFAMALDRIVRCHVGQACPASLKVKLASLLACQRYNCARLMSEVEPTSATMASRTEKHQKFWAASGRLDEHKT
jgi:hypothetical protein